ncbi:MAG: DUF4390 domain-containing protein [Betaproteobacteria bacterium]|nr:DUF4390 domain-containing protein [Betaproteobacteria bacterium]MDE2122613.1 DUF4390 domain-containing protein [Betaproteobacteria bacterium]MDE2186561.1 DUF4390 domain-containing protein [Betaproteobacteria bacterium]MDE2324073.1 DUF4390 domain-containing protein [Betaproteobacteria bacterium]
MSRPQAPDPIRRRGLIALGVALTEVLWAAPARAATVDAQPLTLDQEADGLYVSATLVFALPRALEDALHRGIPLYFLTRIEVVRGRWWWFDEKIGSVQVLTRLAYQPLLEKYRVSTGALQKNYNSLDEALSQVQHALHLKVVDAKDLVVGQSYSVYASFELDLSQLPRPFQINVSSQADWQLQADFPRANFTWKPPPSTASPG